MNIAVKLSIKISEISYSVISANKKKNTLSLMKKQDIKITHFLFVKTVLVRKLLEL